MSVTEDSTAGRDVLLHQGQNIPNIHLIVTKAPVVQKRYRAFTLLSSISTGPVKTKNGVIIFFT
jgi:hypothetical protein